MNLFLRKIHMRNLCGVAKASFVISVLLVGCAGQAPQGSEPKGYGANPVLPAPEHALLPTVNIAPAASWTGALMPLAPKGFVVSALATGLQHPRWLHVLPNGDILVAESDAPVKHDQGSGIKGAVMRMVMKWAGAGVPSLDRILLLRQQPGKATQQTVFLDHLHSPFGMALIGDQLYVANTDALIRYTFHVGSLQPESAGTKVIDLPAGPINHHWTKNILASEDGKKLYITVGSNSNVMENGAAQEVDRARILQLDLTTNQIRSYATGLRNPNGMDWQPESKSLWTALNERDELGIYDGGQGRRVLWVAIQLLRPAC
jgi:glucose/arabinose dehydrogenase